MRPLSANSGLRGPPLNLCDIMQRGYLSQVPMLVNMGSNLEVRDATGRTPLMMTAYVRPEEWGVGVARLLIEMGVRMSHRDRQGMNVLHHAAIYERLQLAKVLLNAPDFDLVQVDKFGNTALHYTAISGNTAMVKLLVANHARFHIPLTKTNKQGCTAKDEAIRYGRYECAAILDDAIASQVKANNRRPSRSGEKSIFFALGDGQFTAPTKDRFVHVSRETVGGTPTAAAAAVAENGSKGSEGSASKPEKGSVVEGKDSGSLLSQQRSRTNSASKENDDGKNANSTSTDQSGAPSSERDSATLQIKDSGEEADPKMFVTEISSESPTHDDDTGGLFPKCDPDQQLDMVKKLQNSQQSLLTSDRSTTADNRSSDSSPMKRTRKPAARRPQSAFVVVRKMSLGSDSSSRSAGSASGKPPLFRKRKDATSTSTNANGDGSNVVNNNSNNGESQNNSENESVQISDLSAGGKPRGRTSPGQEWKRSNSLSSILRENFNNVINNASTNNSIRVTGSSAAPHARPASAAKTLRGGWEVGVMNRSSSKLLLPYERDPSKEINVASENDFRNSPEYVLKLTKMEFHPGNFHTDNFPVLVPTPPPSIVQYEDLSRKQPNNAGSWRENIRFLYRHYEEQCSPSWRNAPKPRVDPATMSPVPPSQVGEETEEGAGGKDRKPKRPSSSVKSSGQVDGVSTSSGSKRKPPSGKSRKTSTNSPPTGLGKGQGDPGADTSTISSSESLNTGAQSRKKLDQSKTEQGDSSSVRPPSGSKTKSRGLASQSAISRSNSNSNNDDDNNTSDGVASTGTGSGTSAQYRNLPAVTEAPAADDDNNNNNDAEDAENAEPNVVDISKLTVLSDDEQ